MNSDIWTALASGNALIFVLWCMWNDRSQHKALIAARDFIATERAAFVERCTLPIAGTDDPDMATLPGDMTERAAEFDAVLAIIGRAV